MREFDAGRFAEAMRDGGAGCVIFTVNQRTPFLIAPNAAFDRITSYAPGEACATRDLVLALHSVRSKYRIPLLLYTTKDGPCHDAKAAAAFEINGHSGHPRFAALGVDGPPETCAMGGGEWPWT